METCLPSVRVVINSDLAAGRQYFLTSRLNRDMNSLENILIFKIPPVNRILCICVGKIQEEMFHRILKFN